jgi:hypothetical protein
MMINTAAVTSAKLANGSVHTTHLVPSAVTSPIIAAEAVVRSKIGFAAVGQDQIASGSIANWHMTPSAVQTANIADFAITMAKLANAAVATAKIADAAVTTAKIADAAITNTKLAAASVTSTKLGSGAVNGPNIAVNAVTGPKIAPAAISSTHLNAQLLLVYQLPYACGQYGLVLGNGANGPTTCRTTVCGQVIGPTRNETMFYNCTQGCTETHPVSCPVTTVVGKLLPSTY